MTIVFAALALWFTLLIAPDTPIGRSTYRWTVAKPAGELNRITRGHVLLVVLLVTSASLIGWLLGHEAVRLAAMAAPEIATWITMFEVTAYLDAVAALVTAASAARWAGIRSWIARWAGRRSAAPRAPRTRPMREPVNDDEDSRATGRHAA